MHVMATIPSPASRFRELRERAGLSHDEMARRLGISPVNILDIESSDTQFTASCSPIDVQQFCGVLGVRPVELFGVETTEPPISAAELVKRIYEQCRIRNLLPEQFDDAVGWCVSGSLQPPEQLLRDITLDVLQWLCRELAVDWHRVILGL